MATLPRYRLPPAGRCMDSSCMHAPSSAARNLFWEKSRLSYAQAMLPILRIIPVGGVLPAIAILVLALDPPVGPHTHFTAALAPARGPLLVREEHPEWRQLLILAALRRADELSKLRDLPDTPTRTAPPPVVAGAVMQPEKPAPAKPADAGQLAGVQPAPVGDDDTTGSVQSPDAAIPVDIGETSSFELPVIPHEEKPPVTMMPAREIPPPDIDTAPQTVTPKSQSDTAPEPATEKHASRETAPPAAAPPAAAPQPAAPPIAAPKEAAPEPVALQPVAPKEAAPKPVTPPIEEFKAANPEPAPLKQASREVALPPERPKPEIRHAARKPVRRHHEVRRVRRLRHIAKQQTVPFGLFGVLFGAPADQPFKYPQPSNVH
jgi:hypothetical protein